ncbi:MAG: ISNCY family transposase [Terriglobales bacterium]
MKTWETFTMSRKEVPRAGLLKAARAGKITNAQGALAMQLSVRQFQRVKVRFAAEGTRGLLHRLRGRPSPRRLAAEVRGRAAELVQGTYAGLNDCHVTEKLQEVEGLPLSRSSVRRLRRALGLPPKRRRRSRQVRMRRTPEAQMGALVQLDASPFAWLEDRGPQLALHGAIDDATGTGLALYFRPTEDLHGYATLLQQLCTTAGLPLALYGDRLGVFVRNDPHWTLEEELRGTQDPTHFGRILQTLGIGYIAAHSPQAKGRIERFWQTLQDRLVSELRLLGINTLEAANAFLPAFLADLNPRFARAPADAAAAWRPAPRDLAALLSCRYTRTVARDNTVRLGPRWVQLSRRRSYAGRRVELRECLDGRLLVFADGHCLATQPAPPADFILRPRRGPSADRRQRLRASHSHVVEGDRYLPTPRKRPFSPRTRSAAAARTPSPTHPWRHTTPYSPRSRGMTVSRNS